VIEIALCLPDIAILIAFDCGQSIWFDYSLITNNVKCCTDDKEEEETSFFENLVANIIRNLEVSITNIHVRFEDNVTNPEKPFSVGVTLRELSLLVSLVCCLFWWFVWLCA